MTAQSHVIRAAVVQAAPIAFDRERTLAKVRALTGEAASQGAQLVVFPEAFVSAYPRGLNFGAVVGDRSACIGYLVHPFGKSCSKKDRVSFDWLQRDALRG